MPPTAAGRRVGGTGTSPGCRTVRGAASRLRCGGSPAWPRSGSSSAAPGGWSGARLPSAQLPGVPASGARVVLGTPRGRREDRPGVVDPLHRDAASSPGCRSGWNRFARRRWACATCCGAGVARRSPSTAYGSSDGRLGTPPILRRRAAGGPAATIGLDWRSDGRPPTDPDADRRAEPRLSRLLRAAAAHHLGRDARERRLRLPADRAARDAGPEAGLRDRQLRPGQAAVPFRRLSRLQGRPPIDAGRPARASSRSCASWWR